MNTFAILYAERKSALNLNDTQEETAKYSDLIESHRDEHVDFEPCSKHSADIPFGAE